MAWLSGGSEASAVDLYSNDGHYLGQLGGSPYDQNSTSNPYGRYGSPYSMDSINNPYGRYGSPYSMESPNDPYGRSQYRAPAYQPYRPLPSVPLGHAGQ